MCRYLFLQRKFNDVLKHIHRKKQQIAIFGYQFLVLASSKIMTVKKSGSFIY